MYIYDMLSYFLMANQTVTNRMARFSIGVCGTRTHPILRNLALNQLRLFLQMKNLSVSLIDCGPSVSQYFNNKETFVLDKYPIHVIAASYFRIICSFVALRLYSPLEENEGAMK